MAKVTRRPGILPSGKYGDVVYYKKGDEVFAREWVMPNDPKTAGHGCAILRAAESDGTNARTALPT